MIILFYCHSELSGVLLSSVTAGKSIKSMNPYIQHVLVACWAFKRTIFMNSFLLSVNLMSTICTAFLFSASQLLTGLLQTTVMPSRGWNQDGLTYVIMLSLRLQAYKILMTLQRIFNFIIISPEKMTLFSVLVGQSIAFLKETLHLNWLKN